MCAPIYFQPDLVLMWGLIYLVALIKSLYFVHTLFFVKKFLTALKNMLPYLKVITFWKWVDPPYRLTISLFVNINFE